MSTEKNKLEVWSLFTGAENIVLTTHVRPDGDGIASELALYRILRFLGKKVYVLNQDKVPDMYVWLPDSQKIISLDESGSFHLPSIDLSVLLDCSSRDRIGSVYESIKHSKTIVSIDHHQDSDCFRDGCYIDTSASSVGELLFGVIPDIKKYIDHEVATCFYASILTDTGSFAFSNTSKRVFQIVAKLMDYGVCPDHVFQMIYNQKKLSHFRLLGKALELMKTDETGRIVYVILPLTVYKKTGAGEEDNEGILEVIRGLRNCELIIMLRQLNQKSFKGSLRSIKRVNCNYLARLYGGGGHFKASGFVQKGDVRRMGPSMVERICRIVKEKGWV